MALTNEERLEKLKQHDNWWQFTDPQRQFLAYMAEGLDPLAAGKKAYPDCKSAVVMVKSLLARVGIQSALESIGLDKTRPNVTKAEAIKQLSRFMRSAQDINEYCKAFTHYSKLQGWNADEDETPDDVIDLNKLAAAIDKKRKQHV